MNNLNANKVGLSIGLMTGGFHLCWSVLIFLGLAQPLMNFIFDLHMISPFVNVLSFDPMKAVELIIFTSIVGYVSGYVGAMIWNMAHGS